MNEALTYPYRRFSSDLYASSLLALLDEHQLPWEMVSEPENIGSVFAGAAGIPGVIVMVRPSDAKRIQELEQKERPVETDEESLPEPLADEEKEFETIHPAWIFGGYIFCVLGAPIAIIFGLHLFSAKRRKKDFSYGYAYDADVRMQGRIIFFLALGFFLYGWFSMIVMHSRNGLLEPISFLLSRFRVR